MGTLTNKTIDSINGYVVCNYVHSFQATFVEKQIFSRGAYLALAPLSIITVALDTIVGIGAATMTLLTLGCYKKSYSISRSHFYIERGFINPYLFLLRSINPNSPFQQSFDDVMSDGTRFLSALKGEIPLKEFKIGIQGNGLFSNLVIKPLIEKATDHQNSNNFLNKHIVSRLTYALLAISCVITRVADAAIALPAVALSLITLGQFNSLNCTAIRALYAPRLAFDLYFCLLKIINPWAGT